MLPALMSNKALSQAFNKSLPKYYTSDEIREILSEELRQADYKAWFLILFLWNSGMRVSEALSVKVEDIDMRGRVLRVKTLKRANHMRIIPLQNGFVGEIATWIHEQELKRKDTIFSFKRVTAYNKVQKACKMAELDKERAHPHTFRHSFAVNCIMSGVPKQRDRVSERMGGRKRCAGRDPQGDSVSLKMRWMGYLQGT
jgi:integrase